MFFSSSFFLGLFFGFISHFPFGGTRGWFGSREAVRTPVGYPLISLLPYQLTSSVHITVSVSLKVNVIYRPLVPAGQAVFPFSIISFQTDANLQPHQVQVSKIGQGNGLIVAGDRLLHTLTFQALLHYSFSPSWKYKNNTRFVGIC